MMGLLTKKPEAEYKAEEPKQSKVREIERKLTVSFRENRDKVPFVMLDNTTNGGAIPLSSVIGVDYRFTVDDDPSQGGVVLFNTKYGHHAGYFTNYKEMEFIFNGLNYPMPVSEKVPDAVVVEE